MLQLHVSVDIEASASQVWAILTDFASYRRWNPFIRAILGKSSNGNRLRLTLQRHGQPAAVLGALEDEFAGGDVLEVETTALDQ